MRSSAYPYRDESCPDNLGAAGAATGDAMCRVVNVKQSGSVAALNRAFGNRWVYIGRVNAHLGLPASPLANPYRRADYGGRRGATLPRYRRWLWGQIQAGNTAVIDALRDIDEETILVCWCKPGPCHGDVVCRAATWLRGQVVG